MTPLIFEAEIRDRSSVMEPGKDSGRGGIIPMKHPDQYAGIFWFIVGGAVTISSFFYGVGSSSEPGPGFITFLAGGTLTVLSVVLFIASGRSKLPFQGLRQIWEGLETKKVVYMFGLLLAYTLLIDPVGFLITTFLLLMLLFRVQGSYSYKSVLLLSAASTILSFIVFDQWLGVQLPRGFMGYFLF
jgi:putative tricarboxylic transport membrane protein